MSKQRAKRSEQNMPSSGRGNKARKRGKVEKARRTTRRRRSKK